ncbi:MAG TPA: hypothetical protein VFA26_07165 [Gemmataceae bacterium]|nr:hypothetical protein [Gemmataceae bacterium]
MAMTFDATLKDLGTEAPGAYLKTFDRPPTLPVSVLNVDLSTVTAAADLVIGLGEPLQEIVHIDFQSSAAARKHADMIAYNVLLYRHYDVPVHSIVVLLRPQAVHSNLSGAVSYSARPGRGSMNFGYEVIRLWERPADELLAGELHTLPLAVLGRLAEGVSLEDGLAAVARRLIERLDREASPERAQKLLTSALLLTGLRVRRDVARQAFQRARAMDLRDSDTYLAILEEGCERQVKKDIARLGQKRFGPAEAAALARLQAMTDLSRLERILDRVMEASGWQDLLDTP